MVFRKRKSKFLYNFKLKKSSLNSILQKPQNASRAGIIFFIKKLKINDKTINLELRYLESFIKIFINNKFFFYFFNKNFSGLNDNTFLIFFLNLTNFYNLISNHAFVSHNS